MTIHEHQMTTGTHARQQVGGCPQRIYGQQVSSIRFEIADQHQIERRLSDGDMFFDSLAVKIKMRIGVAGGSDHFRRLVEARHPEAKLMQVSHQLASAAADIQNPRANSRGVLKDQVSKHLPRQSGACQSHD